MRRYAKMPNDVTQMLVPLNQSEATNTTRPNTVDMVFFFLYKLVLVNFEGAFPESPSPVSTNDPAIIVSQCDVRRHNDVIEKTTAIVGSRLASEVSRFEFIVWCCFNLSS